MSSKKLRNSRKNKYPKSKQRILGSFCNSNDKGQMIVLMGITLAISVFFMGYIASEISNIDADISSELRSSLVPEFISVRETFGTSLNFNLVTVSNGIMYGEIKDVEDAFERTVDEFSTLELYRDTLFKATLNDHWFSHFDDDGYYVYNVEVTIELYDKNDHISEDVVYSIVCTLPINE